MSLRMALLGELLAGPRSGYELVQRFDAALGNVWTASQSSIYPELVRLEAAGLIETVERGARGRKTYATTAAGRDAVRDWLREPPVRQAKDELVLRVFLLDHLDDEEAGEYFATLAGMYAERLEHYLEVRERVRAEGATSRKARFDAIALDAGITHERAMLAWAEASREAVAPG